MGPTRVSSAAAVFKVLQNGAQVVSSAPSCSVWVRGRSVPRVTVLVPLVQILVQLEESRIAVAVLVRIQRQRPFLALSLVRFGFLFPTQSWSTMQAAKRHWAFLMMSLQGALSLRRRRCGLTWK